jgi:hypothetical protein
MFGEMLHTGTGAPHKIKPISPQTRSGGLFTSELRKKPKNNWQHFREL